MSFADVAARLNQVVELAGRTLQALRQASDTAADSTTLITESMAGTSQESEAAEVTANFHAVHTGALDLSEALTVLLRRVEEIRSRFEVGAASPEPTWADQQRSRLPKYITSGYYLDPDGYVELVQSGSEPDGEHDRINAHLVEVGAIPPLKSKPRSTSKRRWPGACGKAASTGSNWSSTSRCATESSPARSCLLISFYQDRP
ncbi:hypothetical protein Lesp01_46160 [Lentzea sp. NBRC 102530]|nr:hypothetical protein [Lentzea sp. NBRC 102530]GLY50960.1 hypothetical protein Lesp01_46160 [Lentzea sp. NBRC 102530]